MTLLALAIGLTGCHQATAQNLPATSEAAAPAKKATMDEWRAALASSYLPTPWRDNGDGITEFMARFGDKANKDSVLTFGKRDAFRNITIFTTAASQLRGMLGPNVRSYVSIIDGKKPSILLNPFFFGKNGWLFMNKLSVMVDGKVIFEDDFSKEPVERESFEYGVEENFTLMLTDADIAAFRQIRPTSNISVRLSGDKGYVQLARKTNSKEIDLLGPFQTAMIENVRVYDALNKAIVEHIPEESQKQP